MTNWRKGSIPATLLSVVALVLPLTASPAHAETYREDVEFSSVHNCTLEAVQGDAWVKITIETTDNGNGTTTVAMKQHTHGQQLLGLISGDWYVFNNGEDFTDTATIFGSSGTVYSRTEYIHTTEDVAFQETAGLDDYHQRLKFTFSPLLPPVVTKDTAECK
jgi:hypothetical protein